MLEVRMLGGLRVLVDGEPLDTLRSGRAQTLLARLVLQPDVAHSRSHLAFTFWPDSTEAQARTNLRNLLHTLRHAHPVLADAIVADDATIRWQVPAETRVDVADFGAAASRAEATDPDDTEAFIAACRTAVGAHPGPLLPGNDDEWLTAERDRLHDRYRALLFSLATALIDHGRPAEARPVTRLLVEADPLDERAHRLRMEAHERSGDRAGAVRAYHECVAALDRHLAVRPEPATEAAYRALLTEDPAPEGQAHPTRAGFVGRSEPWRRAQAAWAAAVAGPPRAVLVTGEPGIGKTRLVDELRAWAEQQGATVTAARSYSAEGELGYGVVTAWLRAGPPVTDVLTSAQTGDLARILPELGPVRTLAGVSDDERRQRLFDAATTALRGHGRPTLLVLDDAHWSDRASLELAHYLLRQTGPGPLLLALTARADELADAPALTALRNALTELERLDEIPLDRLDATATAELGGALTGSPLPVEAAAALFAESEGNPLFVVETVRSGWSGEARSGGLSPRLRAVIDARFGRLSPAAAKALDATAVITGTFSASLVGRVSGLDDQALAQALDELWRRGVLVEAEGDGYEFSHGKLAEAAYERLGPVARAASHSAAADALIAQRDAGREVRPGPIALHLEAADRPLEAIQWHQAAASAAQQALAYPEAVGSFERALALVPRVPADVRPVLELELLSHLPLVLAGVEGYGGTQMATVHDRTARLADRLGVDLDPSFVRSMVMANLCRDELDAAGVAAGRLRDQAAGTGRVDLGHESRYLLGITAFWSARLDEAREHFEAVVEGFAPADRATHHAEFGHDPQVVCLSRLANTRWFLGDSDHARRTCDAALSLAEEVGHPLSEDTAAIFAALLAVDMGDPARLGDIVDRLDQRLRTTSTPHATKHQALAGLLAVLDGRVAEGVGLVRDALDRCQGRNFYPGFRATIARILVAAYADRDDHPGALAATDTALALGGTPLWRPEVHRVRAWHLHHLGSGSEVVTGELATALALADGQGSVALARRILATWRVLAPDTAPATGLSPVGSNARQTTDPDHRGHDEPHPV